MACLICYIASQFAVASTINATINGSNFLYSKSNSAILQLMIQFWL